MECQNCGTYIYDAELKDSNWHSKVYYDFMIGQCPKCGKCYSWTEVYKFSNVEDIEEVQPDE